MNLPTLRSNITSLKRQLAEARDYVASLRIKALLPPRDASQPDTYAEELKPHIDQAAREVESIEARLVVLESELFRLESAPVQLGLPF